MIEINAHVKEEKKEKEEEEGKEDSESLSIATQLEVIRAKIDRAKPDSKELPKLIEKRRQLAKKQRRAQLKRDIERLDEDFEGSVWY